MIGVFKETNVGVIIEVMLHCVPHIQYDTWTFACFAATVRDQARGKGAKPRATKGTTKIECVN